MPDARGGAIHYFAGWRCLLGVYRRSRQYRVLPSKLLKSRLATRPGLRVPWPLTPVTGQTPRSPTHTRSRGAVVCRWSPRRGRSHNRSGLRVSPGAAVFGRSPQGTRLRPIRPWGHGRGGHKIGPIRPRTGWTRRSSADQPEATQLRPGRPPNKAHTVVVEGLPSGTRSRSSRLLGTRRTATSASQRVTGISGGHTQYYVLLTAIAAYGS